MPVATRNIELETRGYGQMTDITGRVAEAIAGSGLRDGTATVFAVGSTASISTVEFEPGLQKDIPEYLDQIAPYDGHYKHHDTWHDDNGAAHVRATLMGPSMTVPFVDGEMTLGTWQQIVLLCFDTRPRRRRVVVQCIGE